MLIMKLSEWLKDKVSMGELPDTEEMADVVFTTEVLEQQVEKLKRVADEYRGAGYHPSGLARCQHGMSHWIGTHCMYDSRALKAFEEDL